MTDDPEVDALFDLPVDEFVAERDRLARERRQAKDRAGADAVKQLRRPTVVAWVLNQLARRHRDEAAELLDLGRRGAEAQRQALAGDPSGLRDVDRRRRAAVAALVGRAQDLPGTTRASLDEVEASLQAASLDPDGAGERWRAGRLAAAIPAASGFDAAIAGWGLPDDGAPPRPRQPGATRTSRRSAARRPGALEKPEGRPEDQPEGGTGDTSPQQDVPEEDARPRAALDDARRLARERARAADDAEALLGELRAELDRLQARIDQAEQRADQAREQAADAQQDLQRLDQNQHRP